MKSIRLGMKKRSARCYRPIQEYNEQQVIEQYSTSMRETNSMKQLNGQRY